MFDICHKVFIHDKEEWVANQSLVLTSLPAQYNCYRLSDKLHKFFTTDYVNQQEEVRYMTSPTLYEFLNGPIITETIVGDNNTSVLQYTLTNGEKTE